MNSKREEGPTGFISLNGWTLEGWSWATLPSAENKKEGAYSGFKG